MSMNRTLLLVGGIAALVLMGSLWRKGGLHEDKTAPLPVVAETDKGPDRDTPPVPLLPEVADARGTATVEIDPANQEMANRLFHPESAPEEDLEIVQSFLQIYSKVQGGNPAGDNSDITSAMTGTNGYRGRVFPKNHPSIREGQMVDRWGTPYWFHSNSGHAMEIRSAGPDRQLFTQDDIVLNPSPEGLGAGQVQ